MLVKLAQPDGCTWCVFNMHSCASNAHMIPAPSESHLLTSQKGDFLATRKLPLPMRLGKRNCIPFKDDQFVDVFKPLQDSNMV